MNKKLFAIFVLGSSILTAPAYAADAVAGQAGDFGVGVILGSPTGLSAKYWLSRITAIDGAVAWHFGDPDQLQLHADYLYHLDLRGVGVSEGRLPFYLGAGVRVLAGNDSEGAIRIPLGISYLTAQLPLEIFAELAPVVEFAPDTDADVEGGVGIRFYFK
jgi:hypothetical protein